jgi:uncharacterized membrane protein
MKKTIKITLIVLVIIILLICILRLTGLGVKYPELNDDAIAFNMEEYVDESNDDDSYGTIEYKGRTYIPYGTLKHSIKTNDINECIGYIIQDENNKNWRIYTLTEDSNNNYLMVYDIETNLMNQPDFYRAIDTKGENIDTPSYIDPLDYNFWNN